MMQITTSTITKIIINSIIVIIVFVIVIIIFIVIGIIIIAWQLQAECRVRLFSCWFHIGFIPKLKQAPQPKRKSFPKTINVQRHVILMVGDGWVRK